MTRLRISGFLFALALPLLGPLDAIAQAASFTIAQHGTAVGTADVQFSASPKGFDTTSVVRVSMKGLNYAISKTEELSPSDRLRHVQLSATVNASSVNVTAGPDAGAAGASPAAHAAAGTLITIAANGRTSTAHLAAHPAAVFLPDFDPGALDTLLALAARNNGRDLWAILPKQSGTQPASTVPVRLATYADEHGTLDGKPVEVHHLVATIAGAQTDLFSGSENQLLQAELPQQGFAIIRKGFVLTPPAKAGAPPVAPPQPRAPTQTVPGQNAPGQAAPAPSAPPAANAPGHTDSDRAGRGQP